MSQHHLIFEGPELAGKSWIMSQVYERLEAKYHQSDVFLDGCHWFNCDLGIYGTEQGKGVIENYIKIFEELRDKNILVEKFHLSDIVYSAIHRNQKLDYNEIEDKLSDLGFKIVLVTFSENRELIAGRLADRLNLYPHYGRISKTVDGYLEQQQRYIAEIEKTRLSHLTIETDMLPDENLPKQILEWIGEA